ncbi:hypothetical protein [Lusitaniella coriacea]|nr:hypothetical protein [Lusitaniella coriacea]
MARRDRFSIPALGEYYAVLLNLDSWVNARSTATQANSLLCAKLQERETRIMERLDFLAKLRNVTRDELIKQVLAGTVESLEIKEEEEAS